MPNKNIELKISDGSSMHNFVSFPDHAGPFPAVIVLQEAFGVNHHIKKITSRLASEGYLACAPELFHRTAPPGFEGDYTNLDSVRPHMQSMNVQGLSDDLRATHDWIARQSYVAKDKVASLGFCMGGRVSFLANAILPLACAVSYYGGNMPSVIDKASSLHGPQLFFWGGLDKHITADQIETVIASVQKAGKPFVNVVFSYADHAFNCDDRANYHPRAASEAWAMTLAFLKNNLS
ncbi:MAG: dienelactone hydrolase family protein [Chitinophagales bacterium]